MKPKIGALIPIRLTSERLPNKAIKILCGKPVVCHLLDRVFNSKYLTKENVVVCTTNDVSDDPLVEIVKSYGASVYRGSRNDIIKRFYDAINEFNFDYVIEINGDNITAEPRYMDLTMEKLISYNTLDIVTCYSLPLGVGSQSFSMNAIKKVYKRYKTKRNDTGFIYYFTKTGLCKHLDIEPISKNHIYDNIRLTLDYPEDFEFFKVIFGELYKEGEIFHFDDILNLIKKRPEIVKINNFLEKKYWKRTKAKVSLEYIDEKGKINEIKL
ncbi:MAG: hypothetical protein H0Z29_11150 [Candidatus Marinimicrobia bacterium]|nr:hypothetical protein [Candidatus Neomarinimicrobiota bacterium]